MAAPERVGGRVRISGVEVDDEGRCHHWHGPLDVVAFRLPCCDAYWACHGCHAERADHAPQRWPRDRFEEQAVLCGACRSSLSVSRYLRSDRCPSCGHGFNPRCSMHWPRYFAV